MVPGLAGTNNYSYIESDQNHNQQSFGGDTAHLRSHMEVSHSNAPLVIHPNED